MKHTVLLLAALASLLAAAAAWHHTDAAVQSTQVRLDSSDLGPIAALLDEDQKLLAELRSPAFAENDAGILESYLLKLRRDGIAKTAGMKQRLDVLAENNTAIATLVTAYLPSAKTQEFVTQANMFKSYAAAWRDRWNSSTELFMAGGNYPAASPVFPADFRAAVQAERVATR
jgi:hypothetical protein